MNINTKFDIGEIVFLITDEDQTERIITRITISPNGCVYECSAGVATSSHYELEMSRTADINKQLNLKSNESNKE